MELNSQPQPFLDVPTLLESSLPKARASWLGYAALGFLIVVVGGALLSSQSPEMEGVVDVLSALAMLGLMVLLAFLTVTTIRKHRGEQQQLEAAGELVQLRRWPQAAAVLGQVLSRPARTSNMRTQALIYLAAVLARYHRFEDAIQVQTHLIENDLVDPAAAYGLRLGRAMAMLRQDHLVDANQALSELRRGPGAAESAGLALVEIYRDVKTGHPAEAVQIFEDRLPLIRSQLGHRCADAYALAARAYDLLGRKAEAQDAYTKATLLAPPAELHRRYPESEKLAGVYTPAPAPPGALV